ncbi:MAG: bifunctional precorrin-2 dehydrogenase/sirohydrochlorin ferrochelatase [Anaerolineae bacterium]
MKTYPVNLVGLENERCLVIGGGAVAEGKVMGLVAAGARPIVISPAITPTLAALAAESRIEHRPRPFSPQDVTGAFLVIAATNDPELNRQVWEAARRQGALVNVVDAPAQCHFYAPSLVRRGDFVVSISTGGAAPALAARSRRELEARFGPEYEIMAAWCAAVRPAVQDAFPDPDERKARWYALVDSPVLALLGNGRIAEARAWVAQIMGAEVAACLPPLARESSHERD